ncbi:MAG: amidohydrolase family protein [Armatimonadetes bacterium]|nr:amidohydrolase family protein [Armatimonadota bacterium]
MALPYPVVDTDIHNVVSARRIQECLAEPWRSRYAAGSRGPGHLGYWNPNGVMRSDTTLPDGSKLEGSPDGLATEFLGRYGIDIGILNPAGTLHMGLSPDPDYAAAVCHAENRVVADDWLTADPRYRASITIAPNDPHQAADEIHRWAGHPGFVQVLMCSGARMPYGQRYYHPIYEAAAAHGLPVAIHPGTEGIGIAYPSTPAGYPSTYFEWHTGLVMNYIAHLVSLVCEGVFIRFPALRFVFIEGGVSWLPPVLWRFDKNWKALRQSTPWLERPPSEIAADHVRLTTQPIEEPPSSTRCSACSPPRGC